MTFIKPIITEPPRARELKDEISYLKYHILMVGAAYAAIIGCIEYDNHVINMHLELHSAAAAVENRVMRSWVLCLLVVNVVVALLKYKSLYNFKAEYHKQNMYNHAVNMDIVLYDIKRHINGKYTDTDYYYDKNLITLRAETVNGIWMKSYTQYWQYNGNLYQRLTQAYPGVPQRPPAYPRGRNRSMKA